MAQSAANFSYETAHRLRRVLIEAIAGEKCREKRLDRAGEMVEVVNHTRWVRNGLAEKVPYPCEYSTLKIKWSGDSGLMPSVIRALASINAGSTRVYKGDAEHNIITRYLFVSTYGDPSWSWNSAGSGPDPTRPDSERESDVLDWLESHDLDDYNFSSPREQELPGWEWG